MFLFKRFYYQDKKVLSNHMEFVKYAAAASNHGSSGSRSVL